MASSVFALPRALVSQNKRRYQSDGYDLDLCYVHPRIIVMGFPAAGLETMYRNPRREVQRFLEDHHDDMFKVYNFCAEQSRRYPASDFGGRVERFPIEDHNVPTFPQILSFCEDAAEWLDADSDHVAVLHCKAGKGRAGMMACMLMLRMGYVPSAYVAIDRYNRERVHDQRGLTVTSQKKWVHYCEQLLQRIKTLPPQQPLPVPSLVIEELSIRNALTGARAPLLRLRIFTLDPTTGKKLAVFETTGHERFLVHTQVRGCVQLEFRSVRCGQCLVKKHFKIWFHSMFLQRDPVSGAVVFARTMMDWVSRDRKMRKFPAAFDLEMRAKEA